MSINEGFARFSRRCADALGSPSAFVVNCLLILLWLVSGPLFHYSDTWQLVVNTATTVFTYLAVFVIQNTQNRDARAVHLKLNELIASVDGARNRMVDLEELSEEELALLQKQFQRLQQRTLAAEPEDCRAIRPDDGATAEDGISAPRPADGPSAGDG